MARGTLRVRIVGDARDLQRTLGKATGTVSRFAKQGMFALGAAAVAGTAASIRAFANFDQAMTNSVAIMGDVSDEMRTNMSDAAREVAKTTQFSATEAAESYFFLASAGMDAAASIEALPRVAAFAQAGQFDMARATDLLTDAQSALGLAVDDTAENITNLSRVSDVLVGANTLANASVEQFSEALTQKAGAAMRQLNVDIEEGVAVLAVYADQGSKGSEAGTRLNATLEGLTRTARTNADAYSSLGVAVFDTEGEMRSMADIVRDLEGAFDGMSTEQQLAELASLGLTRQARDGIVALLGNADAIAEYEKKLREAGGTTDEIANNQMQTFWAQLGLVKDQFVDVGISIGSAIMPALMEFAGWIQDRMPAITSTVQGWAESFTSFFTDTEGAVRGNTAVMDGWASSAIRAREKVLEDYAQFPAELRGSLPVPADFNDFINASGTAGDDAGTDFMEKLREAVDHVWNRDIKPWFDNTFLPWVRNDLGPRLADAFWDLGESAMTALGKGALNRLGQIDINLFGGMDGAIDRMWRGFGNIWNRRGSDSGKDIGRSTGEGLESGIEGMSGRVGTASNRTMLDAIRRAQEGVGRGGARAVPIGTSMLSGIQRGLANSRALSGITTAARSAVTTALTAARRAMGISSPSKVMADEIGAPMGEGVIAGLMSQADAIARAQLDIISPVSMSGFSTSTGRYPSATGTGAQPSRQTIVVQLDGREIARGVAPHIVEETRVRTGVRR